MTTPRDPSHPSHPAHHALRAHSFNAAAAQYAANRPSYPPALLDAVDELAGHPLAGARVVDVGAGTGISAAVLRARGARVIGVEPGAGMAAEFRRGLPDVPVVRGDGNALPFADGTADFLTYAQSWHWTDPARAVPEALRVLRPGGALALWWNTAAQDVPWADRQSARIESHFGFGRSGEGARAGGHADSQTLGEPEEGTGAPAAPRADPWSGGTPRTSLADPTGRLDFATRSVRWSRHVSVDTHLANIGSHSMFLVRDARDTAAFFAEERDLLLAEFPDGVVEESYVVGLLVAVAP